VSGEVWGASKLGELGISLGGLLALASGFSVFSARIRGVAWAFRVGLGGWAVRVGLGGWAVRVGLGGWVVRVDLGVGVSGRLWGWVVRVDFGVGGSGRLWGGLGISVGLGVAVFFCSSWGGVRSYSVGTAGCPC
jgi:hypothetical protein